MNSRIVITGIGPITNLGVGKESVWAGLQKGPGPFSRIRQTIGGQLWEEFPLATVNDDCLEFRAINNTRIRALTGQESNRDLFLLSLSAKLALEDSGLTYSDDRNMVGMVMSHENPGFDEYTKQIWTALERPPEDAIAPLEYITSLYREVESAGYGTHSFVTLQQILALLHIHGPALCINNACSSGLFALETAVQWLNAEQADAMVVACGDSPRLLPRYLWLKKARSCTVDAVMRPFDRDRSGFVLGEGAGALVIETLDHARYRGAHIYAEYLGGSFHSDAWKLSLPAPSPNRYQLALEQALKRARVQPGDVDLVVPHGAATTISDKYEAEGITRVFGKNPRRPIVTALKPYVGHTLAGCSLIELILVMIATSHGTIPPTLNWTTADSQLCLEPLAEWRECSVNTWVKTATGFGGFNAACIFAQPGAQA
jgi:3-oxoacyl-[acyl-carrier-protein] synthase II